MKKFFSLIIMILDKKDEVDKEERKNVPRFVGSKVNDGNGEMTVKKIVNQKIYKKVLNQIPEHIKYNKELNDVIKNLPSNYNFEIHKTIWFVEKNQCKKVALQMPEGLLIYSLFICDILTKFCGVETIIMGDVSYGACCIDDFTALALDCDLIVHYGHSCLVPINNVKIKVLYVFVSIKIDETHIVNTIKLNFDDGKRLAFFGTIQFNDCIHNVKLQLENNNEKNFIISAPQCKPLSKGEVLGCTSVRLNDSDVDALIYIGDGRFHLESYMIQNPTIKAFKYDPYSKKFTREFYDYDKMIHTRSKSISDASKSKKIGIILGLLGRQGNLITFNGIEKNLKDKGYDVIRIVLSEITTNKLLLFTKIDAFVQIACPRLSIDWGTSFHKPILTPYETMIMINKNKLLNDSFYHMDYYSQKGYGRGIFNLEN